MNISKIKRIIFLMISLILTFQMMSCTRSQINASSTENKVSVYANPETIQFTGSDRAKMFKQMYLKLGYEFPPQAEYDAILEAKDNDAAKAAYEEGVENLLNSTKLKESLLDFFTKILGVGDVLSATSLEPALLGTYVVLKNKPITEFFLADYGYDTNGNVIDPTYVNGPPKSAMAGFMTTQSYFNTWVNQFGFKWLREVLALGINDRAPFSKSNLYSWKTSQLAPKYIAATTNNAIQCESCHTSLNAYRGALHGYDLTNKTWLGTFTRGTNQYTQELNDSSGLEPRNDNGTIMSEVNGAKLFKLTDDGTPFSTPRQFAEELVKHENFASSWAERLIVYALGLPPGSPGAPPTIPNYFSDNEAKVAFKKKWETKLKDNDMIAKKFLKEFFNSADYLVTGYVDPNTTTEEP